MVDSSLEKLENGNENEKRHNIFSEIGFGISLILQLFGMTFICKIYELSVQAWNGISWLFATTFNRK